jgi:hypothetical protein
MQNLHFIEIIPTIGTVFNVDFRLNEKVLDFFLGDVIYYINKKSKRKSGYDKRKREHTRRVS